MKFDVAEAVNGYTMIVDEDVALHVARTAEEVAEIVVQALGGKQEPPKKARKPRGPNKKKLNSDALAGLNT